jgi:predicted enzyme related to lactoylglutathione lyase
MKRVTGIGGIFFKAKDAPALQAWYKRHLGIDVQEWGGTAFTWTDGEGKPVAGTTEYGKFAWVIDPEGNKVELWQPPAGQ